MTRLQWIAVKATIGSILALSAAGYALGVLARRLS